MRWPYRMGGCRRRAFRDRDFGGALGRGRPCVVSARHGQCARQPRPGCRCDKSKPRLRRATRPTSRGMRAIPRPAEAATRSARSEPRSSPVLRSTPGRGRSSSRAASRMRTQSSVSQARAHESGSRPPSAAGIARRRTTAWRCRATIADTPYDCRSRARCAGEERALRPSPRVRLKTSTFPSDGPRGARPHLDTCRRSASSPSRATFRRRPGRDAR
jgi:hypothetical protein